MKRKHNRTTNLSPSPCTACGKPCEAATALSKRDAIPRPGDITVCWSCGHIMAFADDLSMRDLTSDEMYDVAGDPQIVRFQTARTLIQQKPTAMQTAMLSALRKK